MADTVYDMEFDVCFDTQQELFAQIVACGLTLVSYVHEGPGGGNPCIVLRGSRASQLRWLEMYDPDQQSISDRGGRDVWDEYLEGYGVGIHA